MHHMIAEGEIFFNKKNVTFKQLIVLKKSIIKLGLLIC